MKQANAYFTILHQSLRGKTLAVAIAIALLYIVLSVYAINYSLFLSILTTSSSVASKITVLSSLLSGSWALFRPLEAILLIVIASFLGITVSLMAIAMQNLRGKNGVKFSFGGSSMVAVMSVGCPGCGISLLSLAGITTPLLPIQGVPLQLLSLTMLSGSLVYTLTKLRQPAVCTVN